MLTCRRPLSFPIFSFLLCTILIASCQKQVYINLGTPSDQVVVQGAVETNLPPYVILTKTMGFFSTINLATLDSNFLHNAIITVSNGTKTVNLKEYAIDTGMKSKFYIYSVDTASASSIMLGEVGKFYTLTISYKGNTYTSLTKIPNPKGPDTTWFGAPLFKNGSTPDSAYQMYINYTDPDTPGNFMCYYTQINHGTMYLAGDNSDEIITGKKITNVPLVGGYNNTENANADSLRYFYPGDTVTFKWCQIDKQVYNFWNNYFYSLQTLGNPFTAPTNVLGNVSNGALGVWCGYGSIYYKLIVP